MSSVVDKSKVPWWVSNLIVPLVNLTLALLVSALFIFIAGENPYQAIKLIIYGSFGYIEGFAYTLYYTTNFIFTGLAFAVAFHCRLFNIGGEGQAYLGGLGVFLVAINFSFLPVPIVWILSIAELLFLVPLGHLYRLTYKQKEVVILLLQQLCLILLHPH